MPETFRDAYVVGTYFRDQQAREVVQALDKTSGDLIELVREPENKYDSYAIKVMVGGVHIGYINSKPCGESDGCAPWLAPVLDEVIEDQALEPNEDGTFPMPQFVKVEIDRFEQIKNNVHPVLTITLP